MSKKILGGKINYSNKGLMDFYDKDMTPELVEKGMNVIYNTLDVYLEDYDITTEEGNKNASKYLHENWDDFCKKLQENYEKED